MRDPLSRKLFQSRDAREKLRGMGGIVASSPALAETVARFNNGGDITVPVVGPTPFNIIAQRVPQMSQREMIEAGLPRAGLPRREIVEMLQTVDPNIGPGEFANMSRQERLAAGFSRLGALNEAYFNARDNLLESQFPMQGPEFTPTQEPAVVTYGGAEFAVFPDGSVINTLSNQPVTDAQDPDGILRRTIQNLATRDIPNPVDEFSGLLPETTQPGTAGDPGAEMERLAREDAERNAAARDAAGITDARDSFGARFTAGDEEGAAEIIERAREEVAPPPPIVPDKEDNGDAPPPPPPGGIDFDTTYDQMLARLQNVMGTEDKDRREKAMANLAMIGLAIAAGQSPNALTNIAQGALIGMKGIQEAEAAETAREREMRLEALRLASSEVELNRRLESAEKIAAMRADGGTGTYTPERLYQQNLDAILRNPDMFDVFTGDTVDPAKARQLATDLSARGMSLGAGGGEQQFTPGQLVTQDGVTYEYQQDGSWEPVVGE